MPTPINHPHSSSRTLAWLPVVLIHLTLLALWRGSVPAAPKAVSDGSAMHWVWITPQVKTPPPVAARPVLTPPPPRIDARARLPRTVAPPAPPRINPVRPAEPAAPPTTESAMTIVDSDPFAGPPEPTTSETGAAATAARIRAQARRELGKIDRDLRRASPSQIHAPVSTPQTRLVAGLNDAKVIHWNEAAQVEELPDATGSGRRIARIRTSMGTYCATLDSNRSAVDGFTPNTKGPKLTNCPK